MSFKVSVVTVSFNSGKTIERTVQSVLAQNYSNLEFIIIDGASKDDTLEILAKYGDRISKVISEPDKGIYDAMNKGVQAASGDLIHFLNSDDWYAESNVVSEMMKKASSLDQMYHGKIAYLHADGKVSNLGGPVVLEDLKFELRNFHQPATFFPKKFFAELGNFDLKYRVASDYELMRRFLTAKPSVFVDVTVTKMSDGGASATLIGKAVKETADIAKKFGENNFRVNLRAAWVRSWLWVRYSHPQIYWFFKRIKQRISA